MNENAAISDQSSDEKPDASTASDGGNIKETIESILVAFILAFVFRAFILEAFVIPTGSMATTLLGAHMRFHCPDCGYQFDVNYSGTSDGDDINIPSTGDPVANVYCPNCGYMVASKLTTPSNSQAVHYGDRILVMKYAYLLHDPDRWDVIVFKSPDKPEEFHYQQNYIKRLIGLPGEQIMVLDGDIYVRKSDSDDWVVQTKPHDVQEAMWRLVNDNDYQPVKLNRTGVPAWTLPWIQDAGSGWSLEDKTNPRIFHFDNASASGEFHFDPQANSTTQTLTEYLAYDAEPNRIERRPGPNGSPDDERAAAVSDVKLAAYYQRQSGDGALRLKLSRFESLDHTFTAEIASDTVKLLHRTQTGEVQIGQTLKLADLGISAGAPIYIEFTNVDYCVTLRLNGKDVLHTTKDDYHPDVKWLIEQYKNSSWRGKPAEIAVEAEKQACTLTHVSLWRDVYYENRGQQVIAGIPTNPMKLGPKEYFAMGDNSLVSEDGRYWPAPIKLPNEGLDVQSGRVPAQFLLGKAVFVYWPAGYRPFGPSGFAIIPNFGDMRWIH
jgi:signal peptidase I